MPQKPLSARSKKKSMNLVESVATTYSAAEEYRMFLVQATVQGSCKPFVVDMVLDAVVHWMEVITAASVSVYSLFKLQQSSIRS